MKKLATLAAALALLSATAVPPAQAEFGSNKDRGYETGGGSSGGGGSWSDSIRQLQNWFSGKDVRKGTKDDKGKGKGGNGTRSDPTRGGAYD